jgi:hypothetical protein
MHITSFQAWIRFIVSNTMPGKFQGNGGLSVPYPPSIPVGRTFLTPRAQNPPDQNFSQTHTDLNIRAGITEAGTILARFKQETSHISRDPGRTMPPPAQTCPGR